MSEKTNKQLEEVNKIKGRLRSVSSIPIKDEKQEINTKKQDVNNRKSMPIQPTQKQAEKEVY